MDKKGNTRLQEWLKCLPKQNKALCNPFIRTPLYFFSPELTVVWGCTSSQMSSWGVYFLYVLSKLPKKKKEKRIKWLTSAKCIQDESLLPLESRTSDIRKQLQHSYSGWQFKNFSVCRSCSLVFLCEIYLPLFLYVTKNLGAMFFILYIFYFKRLCSSCSAHLLAITESGCCSSCGLHKCMFIG